MRRSNVIYPMSLYPTNPKPGTGTSVKYLCNHLVLINRINPQFIIGNMYRGEIQLHTSTIRLSFYPSVCGSTHLSVVLPVCLVLPVYLWFYLSLCLCFYPSVCGSTCLSVVLPVCLSVVLPVCLWFYLSVCGSTCLSALV